MYKTNNQAWDEVTKSFADATRRTAICQKMFGQDNLIGLSDEQRDEFFSAI
tara:strand:- start:1436 stop:1588 length:153 start_codon:yes stop_codon:yes gene_type:complete